MFSIRDPCTVRSIFIQTISFQFYEFTFDFILTKQISANAGFEFVSSLNFSPHCSYI